MNKKSKIAEAIQVLCLICTMFCSADLSPANERSLKDRPLPEIADAIATEKDKDAVASLVAEQRLEAIKKSTAILRNGTQKEKLVAAKILGSLRAKEAIDPLLDNIDLSYSGTIRERSLETLFPLVMALSEIGYDSVKAIRQRIGQETKEQRIQLMLLVLTHVLDPDERIPEMNKILAANKSRQAELSKAANAVGLLPDKEIQQK